MAYGYRALLTIDHTVTASTLTNFPVVFLGDSHLKTVGNGGYLINLDGGLPADLIVTSDSAGMTTVPFEIVAGTYVASTGAMELHFLVASVSHTVDTVYYLWVGNAAVTTYQGSNAAVWTAYKAVYHMPDGSTLSGADSTGNHTATLVGTPTAVAGQIDGGAGLNGLTQRLDAATSADFSPGTGPMSLSAWFKSGQHRANFQKIFDRTNAVTQSYDVNIYIGTGQLEADIYDNGTQPMIFSSATVDDNAWHLMHFVRDTANSVLRLYLDGVSAATAVADGTGNIAITGELAIGATHAGSQWFTGSLDEARVALAALSADWIAAEYANQKTSQTLFTLGPFVPQGGSTPNLMMWFASQ